MSVVAPGLARTQAACGERDAVVANLSETLNEVRRGGGSTGTATIFEVWASEETGTWTILISTPNGQACVMASGDGWRDEATEMSTAGASARLF